MEGERDSCEVFERNLCQRFRARKQKRERNANGREMGRERYLGDS